MRRLSHCAHADPIRWLAAGIDPTHSMLSSRLSQPPRVASPNRLAAPPDSVSARPTSLSSAPRPIAGIRTTLKSP